MAKTYPEIDARLRLFIADQHVFFVASAPTGPGGHVNCSPKGLNTFRILEPTRVAYLDFVGSGVETIAHVRQNGRVVIMFCAFEGPPKIVRLHGRGTIIEPDDPDFPSLLAEFDPKPGIRAIVRVDVTRISDSCGYGVPLLRFEGERAHMIDWALRKKETGLVTYQREENAASLDGLPGLRWTDRSE
jgi:Pyridoxamine 5'-phosphate oxidase